jgi:hypothetical protein
MHTSFLDFNTFLPIGWRIFGLSQNSFKKRQVAICRFLKRGSVQIREMCRPTGMGELHSLASK